MTIENLRSVTEKETGIFNADFDTAKFVALYYLTTGKLSSKDRLLYLRDFVRLSLQQGSGGFDAQADQIAQESPNHTKIIQNYWGDEQKDRFRDLIARSSDVYSDDEIKKVHTSLARCIKLQIITNQKVEEFSHTTESQLI